jgi:hypothetical protein
LHHDLIRKELYFAIILRTQHSLTICKINFSDIKDLKVFVEVKQLVREKEERKYDLYEDSSGPRKDGPTEL